MSSIFYFVTTVLTIGFVTTHWVEPPIPDYLKICEKSEENLAECVKSSIELFQTALINGIPDMNITSIDPLQIGNLFKSNRRSHGTNLKVRNVNFMGILKFKIDKLHVVKHGKLYNIHMNFPKLQVEGACEFDVKYKSFAFNESCSFVETFNSGAGKIKVGFSHVPDGWLAQIDKVEVDLKVGKGIVKVYDLERGRRILDQYDINNIINDSFKEINRDMIPVVEKALEHQLMDILNKILGRFSYGQLFPL